MNNFFNHFSGTELVDIPIPELDQNNVLIQNVLYCQQEQRECLLSLVNLTI